MRVLDIYREYCRLTRQAEEIKKQAEELRQQLIDLLPAGVEQDGVKHVVIERGSVKYKKLLDAVCSEVPQAKALAEERKALYTTRTYVHKFLEVEGG